MSDVPPGSGWSPPPQDGPPPPPPPPPPAPPPPSPPPGPTGFQPPTSTQSGTQFGPPPVPGPGWGAPPGHYTPGPLTSEQFDAITPAPIPEPPPIWKRWWFIAAVVLVVIGGGALIWATTREDDARQSAADTLDTLDEVTIPEVTIPEVTIPDISIPELSVPDISIPEISIPDVSIPEISVPDESIPDVSIPELSVPELSVPEDSIPDVTVPGTSTPPSGQPVVGETVTLSDGTIVRLNAVTANAPPIQEFFPVDEGNTLTRFDFEGCAGSAGFASLNPLYWTGTLDDGSEAETFLFSFDLITLQIAPGACVRAQVDVQVPAERTVVSVGMRDTTFQEAARWDATSNVAVSGPLVSAEPIAGAPVGQAVSFADGATATVKSVLANAAPIDPNLPPDEGRQLVQIDVQMCAGSSSMFITPQNFYGVTSDSQIGAASFLGSTLPSAEIAAGQCASGLVDIDIAAGATIRDIVLGDETTIEVARWRVG